MSRLQALCPAALSPVALVADYWSGYGDQVLCYDTHTSKWSRIGVMPYGLGTLQSVTNGSHIYTFGGEPTTHHVRAAAPFAPLPEA